jgi:hypothetical protein
MVKKLVLGVLFVGLVGVLVVGAINRTLAKMEQSNGGRESSAQRGQNGAGTQITFAGTVAGVGDDALTLVGADGEQVMIEGRAWLFACETNFAVQPGEAITARGFFEDGEFKVSSLYNAATGAAITIRDESGRPAWAGRGGK